MNLSGGALRLRRPFLHHFRYQGLASGRLGPHTALTGFGDAPTPSMSYHISAIDNLTRSSCRRIGRAHRVFFVPRALDHQLSRGIGNLPRRPCLFRRSGPLPMGRWRVSRRDHRDRIVGRVPLPDPPRSICWSCSHLHGVPDMRPGSTTMELEASTPALRTS